ncbi:JmjC domain-containing protein [Actinokineospora terrae]|uniref:Cupin superfamily protein n=1 Tax=Actinokineospora terrae TaxID=155974 RepID=A0A1H9WIZ5_9PSEU|nr:cupin domain-containing protein [Actinokineospora terrae]SES33858.1 Cupin superfamily protein [Actinokineospora terrae]
MALARCTTLSTKAFRAGVQHRRHLHTTAAELPGGFGDLFSAAVLERLLADGGLRTTSARLVRAGKESALIDAGHADPGDRPGSAPFLSTEAVRAGLASGHTLVLRALHRYHPPLRRFTQALSEDVGHPVRVNAFVTPPHSQGVDLHFDVQDVFVLQIAGEKHWELRAQPLAHPLPSQAWFDVSASRRAELAAASTPLDELTLRPGDTLYFPRGTMHSPRTTDELSIHLTFAIPQITRHDLLTELVAVAGPGDEWLRESVSLAELEDDDQVARATLRGLAQRLAAAAESANPADLLWAIRSRAFAEMPAEPVPVLPPTTPPRSLRVREGVRFRVVDDGDSLALHGSGKRVRLPVEVRGALDELRSTGTLDRGRWDEELTPPGAEQLVRVLTDIGLLTTGPVAR